MSTPATDMPSGENVMDHGLIPLGVTRRSPLPSALITNAAASTLPLGSLLLTALIARRDPSGDHASASNVAWWPVTGSLSLGTACSEALTLS
ncbi:MAG TPA: hypothetical protein VGQ50_06665 [Actinomycetota bacterium]|nr:hypothetical protein [Actinomycetota bacterium]